jgi:hypothetical protein
MQVPQAAAAVKPTGSHQMLSPAPAVAMQAAAVQQMIRPRQVSCMVVLCCWSQHYDENPVCHKAGVLLL